MKKLLFVFVVLGISLQSFAGPKEKDFLGTWKYKVETDEGTLTGTMKVEKKDGKLLVEVNTDEGEIYTLSKVELKENDVLYMELDTGYEILELSLTLKDKVLEGTVGNDMASYPMICEKVE